MKPFALLYPLLALLLAAPTSSLPTANPPFPLSPRAKPAVWQPPPGTTFQIILNKQIDTSRPLVPDVSVFLLDLFHTPAATIAHLHARGKRVVCYFSAGSHEPYTPDAAKFAEADLGSPIEGWEEERWLDYRNERVRRIMAARIALAAEKGCDAVDPDNLDGYTHTYNSLSITRADAVAYLRFLAATANAAGLAIGLKNCAELVSEAVALTQFTVNEQCHEWAECGAFQPFVRAGKAVFNIEYPAEDGGAGGVVDGARGRGMRVALAEEVAGGERKLVDVCRQSKEVGDLGLSTVVKRLELDGRVRTCGGQGWQQTATL